MKRYLQITGCFLALFLLTEATTHAQAALQSPSEYLGYELGSRWTPHYKVLNYFRYVAEQSPLAETEQYGTTNEGRELIVVKIASEKNIGRLEEIRTNNLKRTGLIKGRPKEDGIAIVWLSYNVHGNEASSSEAALQTLYELVRPGNDRAQEWLKNTVVIMDPMINPDGRDRYVHWYTETAGDEINVHGDAREHHEPWPGGRTNHYYFDLNRDWAWLTQKESRRRVELYQQWMPHIHVDFHEQRYTAPYYFAPAAEPFHGAITDWQSEFQYTIGKNHAKYFDEHNWLYFTGEVFDLFYPSYGDTYPLFNGAIGMTYEQGGSGYAGLGILKPEGDTLTLSNRLTHHYTTGMSTIEIASQHAKEITEQFSRYFSDAVNNPSGRYKTFVIKGNNNPDKIRALLAQLDRHNIRYGKVPEARDVTAYNYATGRSQRVRLTEDDYAVSAYQPKSVLVRVLFEPRPELADSATYDITAWERHYAYGLDGYALTERINPVAAPAPEKEVDNSGPGTPYAYLAEWKDPDDVKMLAALLRKNIRIRFAEQAFQIDGRNYNPGTLIITRNGNTPMGDAFDRVVREIATAHQQQLYPVTTGMVTAGPDFGSSLVSYLRAPKVALLSGPGTNPYSTGEIWHYFDRQINYPVTLIDTGRFNDISLHSYDVLILPSGNYDDVITEQRLKEVRQWVSDGGTLIAIQAANQLLAGSDGFALQEKEMDEHKNQAVYEEDSRQTFGRRRRSKISEHNPGSIFNITMDPTHPLGYGYDTSYFSLKLDAAAYARLDDGWNVGVAGEEAHMSGFAGYKVKKKLRNTLTFGVQNIGEGSVVYMVDNPLFRAFWYNGKLLFGNAVFMVGQ